MNCKYSITVSGKKYILFESDEELNSLKKLKTAFRKNLDKDNLETIRQLRENLVNLENIPEINLNDINENSVGVYTPAELISEISTNVEEFNLFKKLRIPNLSSNIVIAGFGDESVRTKFYKGHIFLNLNYIDSFSNNLIALTELALYNVIGESEYNKLDLSELLNSTDPADQDVAESYLNNIIKNINTEFGTKLKNKIKAAYYKSTVTPNLASTNINTERLGVKEVWDKFYIDTKKEEGDEGTILRNSNYAPKGLVRIEDLNQGDMVLIPNPEKIDDYKVSDWYELFYDYYVDNENNFIIRTIGKNTETGTVFLRKRPASKYAYYSDGTKYFKEHSNNVEALVRTTEKFDNYRYNDNTEYVSIPLIHGSRHFKYEWTAKLLSNPGAKVLIKHKANKSKKIDAHEESFKIKSFSGQIVTLENGQTLNIYELKDIQIPVPLLSDNLENFQEGYKTPSVGDKILAISNNEKVVGLVVGFDSMNDKVIYIYKSKKGFISTSTEFKNILMTEKPKNDNKYKISSSDRSELNKYIKNKLKTSKSVKESIKNNINQKGLNLDNLTFNVEDINKYTSLKHGDILYNPTIGIFHKVVERVMYNLAPDNSYVKTIKEDSSGNLSYENILINQLNNYIRFSETLNTTFAKNNIEKNRYELFANPQETGSYVEVDVYQNKNNSIFVYPKNQDVTKSAYYDGPTTKKITEAHINTLSQRYKWSTIPKSLYAKLIDNKSYKKDTLNTNYIPYNSESFKNLLKSGELSKLIPGSFITFKGEADAYIIEKVLKDSLQVAKYSYTRKESPKVKGDLSYVKFERFILDESTDLEVVGLHTPKWAPHTYELLKSFEASSKKSIPVKQEFNFSDSKELIVEISNFLANKFGVNINIISNLELQEMGLTNTTAAFVTKDEIYVNIDIANIADPLHEVLHLVLATLKASDPDNYYRIVNSVQNHPMFNSIAKIYNEINTELLEETFIKLFTLTFRKNILKEGVFSNEVFDSSIKKAIAGMLDLQESLDWEDPFDLMKKPIKNILTEFGSNLLTGEDSIIDKSKVYMMFDIADTIRTLLQNNQLEQKCNY